MIAFLDGTVDAKTLTHAYINVGGVGYQLNMSATSLAKLPQAGETARIYCYMSVSDSSITLYGFSDMNERELFEKLISVSGVGPKTALGVLSFLSPDQLVSAIVTQDEKTLAKSPGLGKKSASRIILELKDKFPEGTADLFTEDAPTVVSSAKFAGIIEALGSMGFNNDEIKFGLEGIEEDMPESMMLQIALKKLAK